MAAESFRLQRLSEAAGIPTMVLKGAALEMLAYGRLGLKSAWDIDLLVSPGTAARANACLTEAGYDLVEREGLTCARFGTWVELAKDCQFKQSQSGLIVELHWRLVDNPALLSELSVDSESNNVAVSENLLLRTLGEEAMFSYLCVHGALHGWFRLKWLADLSALLATYDEGKVRSTSHRSSSVETGS